MCTAMLYDPKDHYTTAETTQYFEENKKGFERLFSFKQLNFLKAFSKKDNNSKSIIGALASLLNF
jgi:hypothetical protein